MEGLAAAVEASGIASALRGSRWTYPAVNTAHVIGLALLVGAVLPMDLRLIGLWRPEQPLTDVLRLLRPIAAAGAALAILTGALLFSVQARDYAALPLFWLKLGLVALALSNAALLGSGITGRPRRAQAAIGVVSLFGWLSVLVCGRMIGYL